MVVIIEVGRSITRSLMGWRPFFEDSKRRQHEEMKIEWFGWNRSVVNS